MLKYQCDFYGLKERCENPAVVAREFNGKYGREMVQFCGEHKFVLASGYVAEYAIKDDELVETGISKHNRELRVVQRPSPFIVGIDAADRKWLRSIKVSWDDSISEQDRSLLKEMRIVWYVEEK